MLSGIAPMAVMGESTVPATRRTAGRASPVRATSAATTTTQTPTLPTVMIDSCSGTDHDASLTISDPGRLAAIGRHTAAAAVPTRADTASNRGDPRPNRASASPISITGTHTITGY